MRVFLIFLAAALLFAGAARPKVRVLVDTGHSADPLAAFPESGYLESITVERGARNAAQITSYA